MVSCHTSHPYKRSNLSSPSQSFERQRRCHCAPPITFRVLAWLIVVQRISQPICNTTQLLYDPHFIHYRLLNGLSAGHVRGCSHARATCKHVHYHYVFVPSHRDKVAKKPYFCRANNINSVLRGTAAVHLAQT